MKKQVIVIHGGDTFDTYPEYLDFLREYEIDVERYKTDKDDWKPWLRKKLGENYEVILPKMPNSFDAKYSEWKLWLEKILPDLNDEIILIGHSLGATFLVKYLSENELSKKLLGVFLVSGVFSEYEDGYSLASFAMPLKLNPQTPNAFFYHSKDDPVVPFSEMEKIMKVFPDATYRVFEDRRHINQEEFPELFGDILNLG